MKTKEKKKLAKKQTFCYIISMTHKRLVSSLKKKGFEVKVSEWSKERKMNIHYFTKSKDGLHVLEWFANDDDSEVDATFRRTNDISDSMTDYHAGFFVNTIKRCIYYLERLE